MLKKLKITGLHAVFTPFTTLYKQKDLNLQYKYNKGMNQARNILYLILGVVLMTACSSNDSDDWGWDSGVFSLESQEGTLVETESGYTRAAFGNEDIPVMLMDISNLPQWMTMREVWNENQIIGLKIFQGHLKGETVYYIDNLLSSCILSNYFHHDGRQFDGGEWEEKDGISSLDITDWICIYSSCPLIKGITGVFHYDANEETRNHYVEDNHQRYYVWGYLNNSELRQYNGKPVVMSGFLQGEITNIITGCPSGLTCYGLDATYIDNYGGSRTDKQVQSGQ